MLTRRRLLTWLVSLEDDDEHPERYATLRNAWDVAELAAREGLIAAGEQGYGDFARLFAQLKADGWITWEWRQWPPGTRDADEPITQLFMVEHLQRCDNVRVLPAGHQAAPQPGAGAAVRQHPRLEPEQEELLSALVEASRQVPREQRLFLFIRTFGGDEINGGGLNSALTVHGEDVIQLTEAGLLRATSHARGNPDTFVVSPDGLDYYEQMHAKDSEPLQEVDKRLQSYVEAPEFRAACPNAYARWKDAADLL